MNADISGRTSSAYAHRPRRCEANATSYTSIRVLSSTRDSLASQAASSKMSLSRYMDSLAVRGERERVFTEYKACANDAYLDPEFAAEMEQWDASDDAADLDDSGRFM